MAKTKVPGYVAPQTENPESKPIALYIAIGVLVAAGVGALIFALMQSDGASSAVQETSETVTISGEHLPRLESSGEAIVTADPAKGSIAPTISAEDFEGNEVTFGADGPEIRVYLAHWCPHCQDELPRIVDWMEDGTIPDTISVRAISTSVDRGGANYPPSAWIDREGFLGEVIADDASGTAATASGLSGFPYFVALDADGKVVGRGSGELEATQIQQLVALIEAGADNADSVDELDENTVDEVTDVDEPVEEG